GDVAPDFDVPEQKGMTDAPKKLSDMKGKKNVLVAFYPQAFTPGCTTQMCGYRDDIQTFKNENTEVIAISDDQQIDSDKLKEEKKLPFSVVGDPQHKIIEAYGVPLKDYKDKKFAQRSVFLVDKEGKIRYIDIDYKVAEDKNPLYEQIKQVESGGG